MITSFGLILLLPVLPIIGLPGAVLFIGIV